MFTYSLAGIVFLCINILFSSVVFILDQLIQLHCLLWPWTSKRNCCPNLYERSGWTPSQTAKTLRDKPNVQPWWSSVADLSRSLRKNYFLSSTQVYFETRPENIRDPGFMGVNWACVRSWGIIRDVLPNMWDLKPVVRTSSLFAIGFWVNYLESLRLRRLWNHFLRPLEWSEVPLRD